MTEILTLEAETMSTLVCDYFSRTAATGWNAFKSVDWSSADAARLTADQRLAVTFITSVEDHLPGYFAEYDRLFPVDGRVDQATYSCNRELYRFTARWADEEERHAHALAMYQVKSGLCTAAELRAASYEEGRKQFRLAHTEPIQVAMYTLVQEKATFLYYRALAAAIDEPVLRAILEQLAQDEAKHFAFFSRVLEAYVQTHGERVIAPLREALAGFKMPLADTLRNYWRISLRISDAAGGYDYTEAFEDLLRVVQRAAGAATWSRSNTLVDFVNGIRQH